MMFGQKRVLPPRNSNDDCKIKIKNTAQGKTISVSGKCSKEQLLALKEFNSDIPISRENVEERF